MKHLIATPRLILRPPTLEDAQDITRAKQEVWNELQHWMSWAYDGEETHEATLNYLEITFQDLEKGAPHLIARHQQTGDLVCMTGAAPYKDEEGHFTTGYWVTKDYLGQGYATEATNAAVRYAFKALNAKAMHIEYFEGNDICFSEGNEVPEIIFFEGNVLLKSNNSDFSQPDFFATSTSLLEFDEFSLPITKNISHIGAIFFTAFCLFVVA